MIILVNKIKYLVRTEWSEITLAMAMEVNAIEKPKTLTAVYDSKTQEQFDVAVKQVKAADNIEYFKKVIAVLTDAPPIILEYAEHKLTDFYFKHIEKIVVGLYNMYPHSYELRCIKHFKFKGKKYYMPVEETVLNDSKPFANETAATFIEGMGLRSAIQTKVMSEQGLAGLTAVFARRRGEPFTEKVAIQRAEEFKQLTMDNHWEVFFCLILSCKRLQGTTSIYLEAAEKVELN